MLKCDLHIHTTASDGVFTPSKVVLRAKEKGVQMIAITDHDCLSGIREARICGEETGIRVLGGVELSTGGKEEIHVLGYSVNEEDARLNAFLQEMRNDRRERAEKICQKLAFIGKPITLPASCMQGEKALGRPEIARAMMEMGYVTGIQEAFDRYIGVGCPAYVERREVDTADAICLLRSIGAVPVLAHPSLIRLPDHKIKEAFPKWLDAGLMGIEVFHPCVPASHRKELLSAAAYHRLLVTGGSDFHAPGDKHADIGDMIPHWEKISEDAERLLAAIRSAK